MGHEVQHFPGRESRVKRSQRETTHYSKLTLKMRNADYLEHSLSAGSKNRLRQYRSNLSVSRGDNQRRNFDSKVCDVIRQYALMSFHLDDELDYLFRVKDKDGFLFSRCLKRYNVTEDNMTLFSAPDYTSFRWNRNYQKSLEVVRRMLSRFHLKPLPLLSDQQILEVLPRKDTHSGFTYVETGCKQKGDNLEGAYHRYSLLEDKALINGSFNRPIMIAFRTQASGEYDDDGSRTDTCKHKTRVVSMVDLNQIIAELRFSKPIQDAIAQLDQYAGGKNDSQISSIISNWRSKYNYWTSIDYSSYDQTISSWLIEDAFMLLREMFDLDSYHQSLWDIVVHDFIHKDFILSEGDLHSDRGVPSGSMFTQIIDTVVNWIVINTYAVSKGSFCDMIAMGDDNLIFSRDRIEMSELASYIVKNFGLVVHDDDKSNEGRTLSDPPKFLSRYWRLSGTWRHPNQLLSRMIYPERFRSYGQTTPYHVVFAYILSYKAGMLELIDVDRFLREHPISKNEMIRLVYTKGYVPGNMTYQLLYGNLNVNQI